MRRLRTLVEQQVRRGAAPCAGFFLVCCLAAAGQAAGPRVLPEGQLPADQRLEPLQDLNGYFPFHPPADRAEWEQRSEQVRRRILVAMGLWPLPDQTPLNAVVHGRIDQGQYTVEKVYFESFPGFFVTGSLYRPKGHSGKAPGVLCPHGHWSQGRFHDAGLDAVRKQIVQGAERFEEGGRNPLQARCVQLARMGCVVLHYDMIGYADSTQISFELAHRFAKQRPEMNTAENWGLFSPQAEAHLQSVMGLQTYNSIRALDFLTSLSDVDPQRIAVTGASGGGTQTFILSAIEPRVSVSVPAVMVSTAMQGGCTCENACLLRVGTGNIEFAALFAPKPLCLTAADDWTKEMETKGFPELQQHYQMLGAPKNVQLHALTHFGHNYNYVSRSAVYPWFNQHLGLGLSTPIVEEDYQRLTGDQLTVWDDQHPQPEGGPEFERRLLRYWTDDAQRQLDQVQPRDARTLDSFRDLVGGAVDILIGGALPAAEEVAFDPTGTTDESDYRMTCGLLRNNTTGSRLPGVVLEPKAGSQRVTIWLAEQGKAGLFEEDNQPVPAVRRLLEGGSTVIGVDLLYQGEFLADGKLLEQTRRVENPRESAAYTFGYNHAVFAQRVQDVLTTIAYAGQRADTSREVGLVALAGAGPWAAAALAQAEEAVARAAIDTQGFRFGQVLDIHSPDFLPGGAKYFDLPGMLALAAPTRMWLAGEAHSGSQLVRAAYEACEADAALTVVENGGGPAAAVQWLLAD
jgi:dienelactone hydrolase